MSALGGHGQAVVPDGFDEEALLGVAGDDGGAAIAAFEHGVDGVEPEAAFLAFLVMAIEAVLGQHGADVVFEELAGVGRLNLGLRGRAE